MSQNTPVTVAFGDGICPGRDAGADGGAIPEVIGAACDVVNMEKLRTVDGKPGFSLAQGQ